MKQPFLYISFICLFAGACKKETVETLPPEPEPLTTGIIAGLPEHPEKINGYFLSLRSFNGYPSAHIGCFDAVMFSNHAGDLGSAAFQEGEIAAFVEDAVAGDLSVGQVALNSASLVPYSLSGPRYYYKAFTQTLTPENNSASWNYTGTAEIEAAKFDFKNPYPILTDTTANWPLEADSSLMIPMDNVFDNFNQGFMDILYHNYRSSGFVSRVEFPDTKGYFYASKMQVRWLFAWGGGGYPNTLNMRAFNYYHKYHKGKLYLFVFGASIELRAI